jgi:nucleoside-diphosphate-sugar epimerase
MRIVVTGSAGRLAAALLPKLCADPGVAGVIGIDRLSTLFSHAKFEPVVADIREASARALLHGVAGVAHLAFELLWGRRPLREMERANVDGSQLFLSAAAAAGVPRIVHLSSAAVYGQGSDLDESAPLAPLPRFQYACQKARVERWIAHALPRAVVLRPTVILGPNTLPLLRQLVAAPLYVRLPDPQPRLQCVHEDDVADAIVAALNRGVAGAFNLATPSTFALRELARLRRPRAPGVPLSIVRGAAWLAWRTTGWGGEIGWLDGISATLTLACRRAEVELGWRPRFGDWRDIVAASY